MILLKNSDSSRFTQKSKRLPKLPCCKNASRAESVREAKMQHGLLCCRLIFIPLPLDLAGLDQLAQDVFDLLAAQAALEELLDVTRLQGMLASDVGQDLLRHLAAFVLRQEILRGLGQGLARRPRHADAPLDVRKVHSGTTPPAAGGAYGCEPHRRLGAAREVGSASVMLVDVSFDHAGELRVAVVGLLACPRQDVRLDLGAGIVDLDQTFRTGPQVERLQRIA